MSASSGAPGVGPLLGASRRRNAVQNDPQRRPRALEKESYQGTSVDVVIKQFAYKTWGKHRIDFIGSLGFDFIIPWSFSGGFPKRGGAQMSSSEAPCLHYGFSAVILDVYRGPELCLYILAYA